MDTYKVYLPLPSQLGYFFVVQAHKFWFFFAYYSKHDVKDF